jgi:hypothetical protein
MKKERDRLAAEIAAKGQAMQEAIEEFNSAVNDAYMELAEEVGAFNVAIEEARNWVDGVAGDMESCFSDRSEKWQESTAGANYQAWLDAWLEVSGELVDVTVEQPEEVECPDFTTPGSAMEALLEEPEV